MRSRDLDDAAREGTLGEDPFAVAEPCPAGESGEGWEAPTPLEVHDLPRFPAEVLPPVLERFVRAVAEAIQTPLDLPGLLLLGVLAVCCQRGFTVAARGSWTEPLSLFVLVSLASGNRKSAVHSQLERPLLAWEQQERERLREPIARAREDRELLEAALKRSRRRATEGNSDTREEAKEEARRLAADLEAFAVPVEPKLILADVTPERLGQILHEQGGRAAILSAEASPVEIMRGRYSNGVANIEVFLQGHAGDTLRVDRIGRGSVLVARPALSIALTVQPDVLLTLGQNRVFVSRGLTARFLYALPRSLVGSRDPEPRVLEPELEERYADLVRALLEHRAQAERDPEGRTLTLGPGAQAGLAAFQRWLEPRLAPGHDLAALAGWAEKLVGATVRIAGLLHLADHALGSEVPPEIHASTVERAVRLARDYLIAHALAAHGQMGEDPALAGARHILGWVITKALRRFSQRDLFEGTKGLFQRVANLQEPLRLLEEHGYLRRLPPVAVGPKGGRPRSPVFEVNPLWEVPSQNRHNAHNLEARS
ncbi:MAG: YfjI family protein [Planctomycetota bacterium]